MTNWLVEFSTSHKLINKFYFLINLANHDEWKNKSMGVDFIADYKMTSLGQKEIKRFVKILKNVPYWDIEKIFYQSANEKIAINKLKDYLDKKEIIALQKVFDFFEKDFTGLFHQIDKKYSKELMILWPSPKYKNILKKIFYLFGNKSIHKDIKIKLVFNNGFNGFFKGRAYDNVIAIEIADFKDRFDLLENVIFVLLHEIVHILISNNQFIKFTINKLNILLNLTDQFKKYKIDVNNIVEETLIRVFVPKGYFWDSSKDRFLNNKKITWKDVIDSKQIHPHCLSMALYQSLYQDIKYYVTKNKSIDEKFLNKMIKTIKREI